MIYEDHQKLESAYDQVLLKEETLYKETRENILSKDKNHDFGKDGFCSKCRTHRTDWRKNDLCKSKTDVKKEGIEVPNMDVGQDPREPYEQHGMEDLEQEPMEKDVFGQALSDIEKILKHRVNYEVIGNINTIIKNLYVHAFSEGQQRGKETWKN